MALTIEGIDTELGMNMLGGDEKMYLLVLGSFCSDTEKWAKVVAAYPEKSSLKGLITAVHGFKSAALNVGAADAGNFAKAIELAAKSGDTAFVSANRERLLQIMRVLLSRCRAVAAEHS